MKCLLLSMELDDSYFMQKAYEQAEQAFEMDEVPVGAVVVIDQRIIARAHNLTERLKDVTAHAEMQAITAAAHFLNGKYLKGWLTNVASLRYNGRLFHSPASE